MVTVVMAMAMVMATEMMGLSKFFVLPQHTAELTTVGGFLSLTVK